MILMIIIPNWNVSTVIIRSAKALVPDNVSADREISQLSKARESFASRAVVFHTDFPPLITDTPEWILLIKPKFNRRCRERERERDEKKTTLIHYVVIDGESKRLTIRIINFTLYTIGMYVVYQNDQVYIYILFMTN